MQHTGVTADTKAQLGSDNKKCVSMQRLTMVRSEEQTAARCGGAHL